MSENFLGKKVLICGAGRGIGKAISIAMSNKGARVFALSRTSSHLEKLADEHPGIQTICADLADWDDTRKKVDELDAMDYLVNNAAAIDTGTFMTMKKEDVDRVCDVNIKSLINVSQVIASKMIGRGVGGSIVNVSSLAAQRVFPHGALYGPSKAAVDLLTKTMAAELGPHKIRVNAVSPTITMTEDMQKAMGGASGEAVKSYLDKHPLGRYAEMEDIVRAVLYLLGEQSSYITGVVLPVDGGYLAAN